MINEQGGLNGRKVNFVDVDVSYSPPKTIEETRRLVEQEGVAFLFNGVGTTAQPLSIKAWARLRLAALMAPKLWPNVVRNMPGFA